MLKDIDFVLERLKWMEEEKIWPNGLRYLWTDAFGVVLLVSLYRELDDQKYLEKAEWVVQEVYRVLGREKGIRIGEAPDRDGQYYHYLAMWVYALDRLGSIKQQYRQQAINLVRDIHPHFVKPGVGVIWKMKEDLSGMYPGYGYGALDPFHGYVVYRLLAPEELESEIQDMKKLVKKSYQSLLIDQDLGIGMMLWMTHFFPEERWAQVQKELSLSTLDEMWVIPYGYFCRHPRLEQVKFAFTNYGISLGLQAVNEQLDRVKELNEYFKNYRSGDKYDSEAITHVMACTSHFPGEFIKEYWKQNET